jgi:gamma-glutamylputrescine oxidase
LPYKRRTARAGYASGGERLFSIEAMGEPYGLTEPFETPASTRLDGRVDVAVVGAGVTGCGCALALAEGGLRVRVDEARRVASGASGRNGGFALRGGALPYHVARRELGSQRAVHSGG